MNEGDAKGPAAPPSSGSSGPSGSSGSSGLSGFSDSSGPSGSSGSSGPSGSSGSFRHFSSGALPRLRAERTEHQVLAPQATFADQGRGRKSPEDPCPVRTDFQRDRDRVIHTKAFRRLTHKTQVFLSPEGDHYRTRITHTLEVSQIARTIARGLRLNEDLTEAIALGHDLGHTPFGHAGEATLDDLVPGGFSHYQQSLRVVDLLERDGAGLNLTHEVRNGIVRHSKGKGPILTRDPQRLPYTLEGQVVRLSDLIAYVNHDLDDALRARIIDPGALPRPVVETLGPTIRARIAHLVSDVIEASDLQKEARIRMHEPTHQALRELRSFLFANLYENPIVHEPFTKARGILTALWSAYTRDPDRFYSKVWPDCPEAIRDDIGHAVADYLASMTDRYAIRLWQKMFVPKRWELM
jgi:dGTPase